MIIRLLIALMIINLIASCTTQAKHVTPTAKPTDHLRDLKYKDQVLTVSPHYFQETPQSRSVIAGSKFYANANYCELIRRYKLKTNVDFNSALNLFKYRAYFMGASRIVIVNSDAQALRDQPDVEVIFHPGLPNEASSLSTVEGDLYECPTNKITLN